MPNRPETPSAVDLQAIRPMLQQSGNAPTTGQFNNLTLRSHFQPIYSLAHSRMVGCEGLMRPSDDQGKVLAPLDAFRMVRDLSHVLTIDRLACAVHVHNFMQLQAQGWLFLNMNVEVFLETAQEGHFLRELLEAAGLPPHRVVLEILERGVLDETRLTQAVEFFRKEGFLIALDDFGAGHSNFDRVWNLQPDIVKFDRSMTTQAGSNVRIRRLMPVMVSLLHEAGSLVLMEGIETEGEALMAMDADADFVQGYYFAEPAPGLPVKNASRELFDRLWMDFREVTLPDVSLHRREVSPYINAIGYAASLLESGLPLSPAVSGFLDLPGAERCFLLDERGRQIGENVTNPRNASASDPRYLPVANSEGSNWSRRFYFRRALEHPGKVQVTRPYLSIAGANQCITVSIGALINGEMRVLCGDVAWRDRGPVKR